MDCPQHTIDFILGLPFLQRYCLAVDMTKGKSGMLIGIASRKETASQTCPYRGPQTAKTTGFTSTTTRTSLRTSPFSLSQHSSTFFVPSTKSTILSGHLHTATSEAELLLDERARIGPGFIVLIAVATCASLFFLTAVGCICYRRRRRPSSAK